MISGFNARLLDDPRLQHLRSCYASQVLDVRFHRFELNDFAIGSREFIKAKIILIAGTDCAVGKRTAAIEVHEGLLRLGVKSGFIFTGQTGAMIGGASGIVLDSVQGESLKGTIEAAICSADKSGDYEVLVVEGQGALFHPQASVGALALLHGVDPDIILLCHDPDRRHFLGFPKTKTFLRRSLSHEIASYQALTLAHRFEPYHIEAILSYKDRKERVEDTGREVYDILDPETSKR